MSKFETLTRISGGLSGTDPALFSASTTDSLATITTPGYMNDLSVLARLTNITGSPTPTSERGVVKVNDEFFINYAETGSLELGTVANTLGTFHVTFDGTNYNLSPGLNAVNGSPQFITQTVTFAQLASAAKVTIQPAGPTQQFILRNIMLSGTGTNFSGTGGNRTLNIQSFDGTVVFANVSAALLQTLATSRWGDAGLLLPANPTLSTPVGQAMVFQYNGGTVDYTAGSATFILQIQETA